ncbi:MoxR family ATPase [Candidatus Gracilibacteria bacterium]|nr:MoxR family ATPase [Candidatus Gracilibacteria bacterium]
MSSEENTQIIEKKALIEKVIAEVHKKIIGQEKLVRDLIIGLLTGGHILLEGVPGVAKTLTIDTLSKTIDLDFSRVQFTPDLLPSDLIGTQIYNQSKSDFETKKGPIFTNFLLADEINRAPSKVQSALLEAMAEKQITIGEESYKLDTPFIVLATQNPIEQSGTYKLPEAELDRFMMKSYVEYPTQVEEAEILSKLDSIEHDKVAKILKKKEILEIQKIVGDIHVSENIIAYITDIISATRAEHQYLSYGVSPRGSISLVKAAKVVAFLDGRDFVIPEDIKEIAGSVLSHRLVLNYDAIAEDITAESIVNEILNSVKIK